MAELSTPILRLKEKNAPHAAHRGLNPFPPKYVFETGLFFDWLSSLLLSKLFHLQALPALSRGGRHCSRATRVRGCRAKERWKTLEAITPTKCKSPEGNSSPSLATANSE